MATIADMQAYNMLQKIGPMNEGLALGGEEEGGRSPYEPYKPAPTGPFVPAPGKGKDKELAREFIYDADPGGVVTPRYFTPPELRQYFRTPGIKEKELYHFNRFIKSMGGGLDTVQRNVPLLIAKGKKKRNAQRAYEDFVKDSQGMGITESFKDLRRGQDGEGFDIMKDVLGLDDV